ARFFKWVSASVATASKRIEGGPEGGGVAGVAGLPPEAEKAKETREEGPPREAPMVDRDVFPHGPRLRDGRFYILRFGKQPDGNYRGVAGHPVEDFETEEVGAGGLKVSVNQLHAPPPCPYCSNPLWAKCRNGHVHCCPQYTGSKTLTCP